MPNALTLSSLSTLGWALSIIIDEVGMLVLVGGAKEVGLGVVITVFRLSLGMTDAVEGFPEFEADALVDPGFMGEFGEALVSTGLDDGLIMVAVSSGVLIPTDGVVSSSELDSAVA